MRRWGVGLITVLGLVALPAVASARTQVVYAGGQPAFQKQIGKTYGYGEVLAFFPGSVTIHAGDSIAWQGMGIDFHTIDLPGKGSPLPLITPTPNLATGVNDFSGNPFWFDGKAPVLGFNPTVGPPSGGHTYRGTSRIESGLPIGPPRTFTVKFPKAGRYAYFCDVHPGMKGRVVVLPKRKAVPSAQQIAATVAQQQAVTAAEAKVLAHTKIHGDLVSLGLVGKGGVEVLRMFQGVTHIKAGTTLTFAMPTGSFETHTATFAPDAYLSVLAKSFLGQVIDPRAVYPSSAPGTGPIPLDPTAHGNGFANTGALQDVKGSPLPALNKITFNKPGTYNFECLIHEFMKGVVVVK